MTRIKKRFLWLFLFIFFASVAGNRMGCGSWKSVISKSHGTPTLKPLIFLVTTATFISSLPIWVGLASRYFAEEGLDVKIVAGTGGSLGIAMLLKWRRANRRRWRYGDQSRFSGSSGESGGNPSEGRKFLPL